MYILTKEMSNDDILNYYKILKLKVSDVFDYMVIAKQQDKIKKWKESKNAVPI